MNHYEDQSSSMKSLTPTIQHPFLSYMVPLMAPLISEYHTSRYHYTMD